MNIVVMGAGAIGSLFGALLSGKNHVSLVGRTPHVLRINEKGLKIIGKTSQVVKVKAVKAVEHLDEEEIPDVVLLTVKSYDTNEATQLIKPLLGDNTIVLSLQNGLDNIEKIGKIVDKENIVTGVTTHGAFFVKPGVVRHTGLGKTVLGELDGSLTKRIQNIASVFNQAGINTNISMNIGAEIWVKAVINSSINPITALIQCKNGFLLEHPLLERIVEKTCRESALAAQAAGIESFDDDLVEQTRQVIRDTSENHSSMLQSIRKGKKTEIDSINGKIIEIGKKHGIKTPFNEALFSLVKALE